MAVAVIGGGIFGALAALRLASAGVPVTLFERNADLMSGASFNNQNRLHLGFHYPRDDMTARQCLRGFELFRRAFADCILQGFPNAYFIAERGSKTSPSDFLTFCGRHGLQYEPVEPAAFRPRVQGVSLGVLTQEVVYDAGLVREAVRGRLSSSRVDLRLGHEVTAIRRGGDGFVLSLAGRRDEGFRAIVNCSYADINRLTLSLGHRVERRRFEYTAVAIVALACPPVGITVLDGGFMTLLPFGKTGQHLLYHVDHVVVASEEGTVLNSAWRDAATSPFATLDSERWFGKLIESCRAFVPDLGDARLTGFLHGPRMVLADRDDTDARPSFVTFHEPGYLTVFSGKIDCATWIADDVVADLASHGLL
ncbi:MAG: FAD-dependent oxidoreductase [Parvibaculaceae bacterium]